MNRLPPGALIRIAYLDDDQNSGELLSHKLGGNFVINHFSKQNEMIDFLKLNSVDIFVLDVHLGETTGFEVANILLKDHQNIFRPILFVSYDVSYETISKCLRESGGEYLSKDCTAEEMKARVHRLMWRPSDFILKFGMLELDILNLRAISNEQDLDLTLKEFRILNFLLIRPEKCIHRNHLLLQVWGDTTISDKTLNSHLSNLRQKILPLGITIKIDRDGIVEIALNSD